jgi:hypothetical protein
MTGSRTTPVSLELRTLENGSSKANSSHVYRAPISKSPNNLRASGAESPRIKCSIISNTNTQNSLEIKSASKSRTSKLKAIKFSSV